MAREVTLVDAGLGNIASVERALIQVGAAVRVTADTDLVARARMVVFPGQSAFGAATQAIVDGEMGDALKMVVERGDPFLGICLGMQLLFDGSDENEGQEGMHVLPGRCKRFPDGMTIDPEPGATETPPEPSAAQTDLSQAQTVAPSASAAPSGGLATAAASSMPAREGLPAALPTGFEPAPEPDIEPTPVPAPMPAPAPAPAPMPVRAPANSTPLVRRLKVPHMGWNSVEPTGEHYYFVHSYFAEVDRSEDVMWMTTYGGIRFPAAVRRNNVLGCQFHPEKSQRAGLKFLRAFLLGGWG